MTLLRVAYRLILLFFLFADMAFSLTLLAPLGRLLHWRRFESGPIVRFHLRGLCRAIGLRVRWQGALPPNGSFLMLANHASYLDVIALGSICPLGFMAKREVASWPVIGFLAKRGTAVFVDRGSGVSRVRALYRAKAILKAKKASLCIFPEGTTTASIRTDLKTWYRGNITLVGSAATQTLCVGLHYEDHEALAWIDDQQLLPHLLKVLRRPQVELFINAQTLESASQLSHRAMSQLAHKTLGRLSESAAERAQYAKARQPMRRSLTPNVYPQSWKISGLELEKSQKD